MERDRNTPFRRITNRYKPIGTVRAEANRIASNWFSVEYF
jgi:hypothetical protein